MMYPEITKLLPIIVLIIGICNFPLSLSSDSRGGYPFTFGREKEYYYKQRLQDRYDHESGGRGGRDHSINKHYNEEAAETNTFGLIMANKPMSSNSLNTIIFNVDHFGARGDGFSDDSQVCTSQACHQNSHFWKCIYIYIESRTECQNMCALF